MQEKTAEHRKLRRSGFFYRIKKMTDTPHARAGTETVKEWAVGLAYSAGAYLIGSAELLFSSHPLGIALLCASGTRVPYILVGLIFSAITSTRVPAAYIVTYIAAAIMRAVARIIFSDGNSAAKVGNGEKGDSPESVKAAIMQLLPPKKFSDVKELIIRLFSENVYLRMMTAAISAFIVSLCCIIAGGFRYYDLFGAIFSIVICPVAVFVYSGYFESKYRRERDADNSALFNIAVCGLALSLLYSIRTVMPFGLQLSLFSSTLFILYTIKRRKLLLGFALSLLCGLVCSPIYAPALVIIAFVYSLMSRISEALSVSAASLLGIAWGFIVDSPLSVTVTLPAFALGGIVYYTVGRWRDYLDYGDGSESEGEDNLRLRHKNIDENERIIAEQRLAYNNERLRSMSTAFAELSGIFFNLSDCLRRPAALDLQRICSSAFDFKCRSCASHDICWGLEYTSMLETVNGLTDGLLRKGKVEPILIPQNLRDRCSDIPEIIERINEDCAKATEAALRSGKTEVFALDYEAISKILNDTLDSDRMTYEPDESAAKKIRALLDSLNITAQGVIVYGKRKKHIAIRGVKLDNISQKAYDLREIIAKECSISLDDPIIEIGKETASLTYSEKSGFSVTHAKAESPSGELGNTSGDTVNLFISSNDYYYSLISDGMGTGKDAAFTSGICSVFLEKMLGAGNSVETSLRMLNNFIRAKDPASLECCATVDLMEFDLTDGSATFIKSGAAPTFILSGGRVEVVKSRTAPIGIIKSPNTGLINYRLKDGDTVVMVSDGIVSDDCDAEKVAEYLCKYGNETYPDGIARELIRSARERGSHDDMSVIVTQIKKAV